MLVKIMRLVLLLALCLPLTAGAQETEAVPVPAPDIPYEKFVLDNGLTLIVHEDRKAPIVAVNVWYHVGSKNEPEGRSGFAHLFEHLMFNGSEHFDDDYFQALERAGATELNGTTWLDRTNYFQNVPTSALDLALWMESDRMGHLLGAIDQEKLDEQRGVVQNEKRQGENQPYGQVNNRITAAIYPDDHPYGHTTIGSMEDLNAATLEDVQEWFKTYYGPSNAVLVLAGDIDAETALEKVKTYFGDIPPGPPIATFDTWIPEMRGERREILQDRVPQARVYKVWHGPQWGTREAVHLDLITDILASGKTSRLYERLVYDDQIATDVSAYLWPFEIAGQIRMIATARPGVELAEVEQTLDEELQRFLAEGPTPQEVERVRTQYRADFIRGIETIGGFGGKSSILAENQVYGGDPGHYRQEMAWVNEASPAELLATARKWLSDGVYVLEVHPFPELSAAGEGAPRDTLPAVATPPDPDFPELQRATLSNGMEVVLAERHAVPLVDMTLMLNAGYAADQMATPGTASLAMNMLDEGTTSRSALAISEEEALLGAEIGAGSNLDVSSVSLSALRENLAPSLELFADVILNPAFPQRELERLKQQQLAAIQREKATPMQMALRVFPELLYGDDHAYSLPFTGSGTEASVPSITRDDLVAFHQTWFKPNNATMVVAGDVTMEELQPLLERAFGDWRRGDVPVKNITEVPQPERAVYLIDRPGSIQSIILAGHLVPPRNNPDEIAFETMNTIFGGSFTSRVNMNLREDKGWAYGAGAFVPGAQGQRPFIIYAPVQSDRTAEAMQEIAKEVQGILGDRPVTPDEVERAIRSQTLTLPGTWETIDALGDAIGEIVRYGLPDDYYDGYVDAVRAMNVEAVDLTAAKMLEPGHMVWVVVGDRAQIEPAIRSLGLGEVRILDGDGHVVEAE